MEKSFLTFFNPFLQPADLFRRPDKHVFRPDMSAIGLFQMFNDLAEGRFPDPYFPAGMVGNIKVLFRQAVIFQVERREILPPGTNRIRFGEQVFPVFQIQFFNDIYIEVLQKGPIIRSGCNAS